MLVRDAKQGPVVTQDVDDAPVRNSRHGRDSDLPQRRLVVERRAEDLPDLDRQAATARQDVLGGHVAEIGDRIEQPAPRVADRHRRDLRDTIRPAGAAAIPDEHRRRLLPCERAATGQLARLHRRPVGMEELEAAEGGLRGCGQELLGRREAGQAGGRVVGIDAVAVQGVHDDAVAEMRQDRSHQLAGPRESRRRAVDGLAHTRTPQHVLENVSRVLPEDGGF
jgi:hypothetical protein